MRIIKDQTAGLVIDIQERLFPYIDDHESIARNTGILVQGLQVMQIPIIVTEQYTKGLGPTIEPLRTLFRSFGPLEKMSFSCCDDQPFTEALMKLGKKFIIMAGIESHVCVMQTTLDLLEKNFVPVVVDDCVSSRRPNDKKMAMMRMRREGAIIASYESVLFELLRYSGTDEFKAISKLVK